MNGYATQLAFWKEASLLAGQSGTAYRPPGIVDLSFRPVVAGTFEVRDPLRARVQSTTVQQSWQISMKREPKVSGFENFWMEALSDGIKTTSTITGYTVETWERIDNPTMPSFGLEFILEDGTQYRFTGAALTRVEWLFESGRLVSEEVEFVALLGAPFTGSLRAATTLSLPGLSALDTTHYFTTGHDWTGGDPINDRINTISAQLIFERDISPAQFNADGLPTRYTVKTPWDFLGRTRARVPQFWAALLESTDCLGMWRMGSGDFFQIEAAIQAKLSGHAIAAKDQIDHYFDFLAIRPPGARTNYTLNKYSRI